MPELLFGNSDPIIDEIGGALAHYEAANKNAHVSLYRQNSASVRIRIIDQAFEGRSVSERSKTVWPFLRHLSEDARSDITVLLLLTPSEAQSSFANADFASPVPSTL